MCAQINIKEGLKRKLEEFRDKYGHRGIGEVIEVLCNLWEKDKQTEEEMIVDKISEIPRNSISKKNLEYISLFNAFLQSKNKDQKKEMLSIMSNKVDGFEEDNQES